MNSASMKKIIRKVSKIPFWKIREPEMLILSSLGITEEKDTKSNFSISNLFLQNIQKD
jgi:hypothetical protein